MPRREGAVKEERGLSASLALALSDDRPKEEWVGLVRTCLQPAFLPQQVGKITLLVLLFFFLIF